MDEWVTEDRLDASKAESAAERRSKKKKSKAGSSAGGGGGAAGGGSGDGKASGKKRTAEVLRPFVSARLFRVLAHAYASWLDRTPRLRQSRASLWNTKRSTKR